MHNNLLRGVRGRHFIGGAWKVSIQTSLRFLSGARGAPDVEKVLPYVGELDSMSTQDLSSLLEQKGSHLNLDAAWTLDLAARMKSLQPLPRPLVMRVLEQARLMHEEMPNVLDLHCRLPEAPEAVDGKAGGADYQKITVVGDTHGQYWDLMNLLSDEVNGFPSASNPYIFNGDMVDRGLYSVEISFALLAMKIAVPESVHILRGNHETTDMNSIYGFEKQVLAAYDTGVLDAARSVFRALPIAATINKKVFVVHGGIGKESCSMKVVDINKLNRFVDSPPFRGPLSELLWSDPSDKISGISANKQRGAGWIFGRNATEQFLRLNEMDMLVRSHECRQQGFSVHHDGRCVTIFSAPNYCDSVGNLGAVLRICARASMEDEESNKDRDTLEASILQFGAVRHPYSKIVETVE